MDGLVGELHSHGIRVWYDAFEIRLGDDIRQKMQEGLTRSRFGVVVVSQSFFKYWPQQELSALFTLEEAHGGKRILPVVRGLSWEAFVMREPLLAGRRCARAEDGVATVARQIAAVVHETPASATARASRLHGVPMESRCFVGRVAELEALERLLAGHDVGVHAAVEGLAGIGKTELAIQLAHRLAAAGAFPGGIYWFGAEDPDLTPVWGTAMADRLDVPGADVAERARGTVNTLSRGSAPLLVILDNVERWTGAEQPGPLPEGVHVRVLVTTRERDLGAGRLQPFRLGFLSPAEARELLLRVSERPGTEPGVDALLETLDGHALAVELAGAWLRAYPAQRATSLVEKLKGDEDVVAAVSAQVRYEATVRRAFEAIWQGLDAAGREAWQVAALFRGEGAGRELVALVTPPTSLDLAPCDAPTHRACTRRQPTRASPVAGQASTISRTSGVSAHSAAMRRSSVARRPP